MIKEATQQHSNKYINYGVEGKAVRPVITKQYTKLEEHLNYCLRTVRRKSPYLGNRIMP